MSSDTERYDDWALQQEAEHLAWVVMNEYDTEDVWNAAYEVCADHEWSIMYYKALRVVAENNTTDAEESVRLQTGGKPFDSIGDHACAIVREMLHVAVLTELDDRGVEI